MQQLKKIITKHWLLLLVSGFILSRLFIFLYPPEYVRYFEEYANIWYYGLPPYLKHFYEYPPATIPFVSGPLVLDVAGIGNYRLNFRLMMLAVDVVMFGIIVLTMRKLKYSPMLTFLNGLFYIVLTIKAKDFMYENLDPLFTLTMLLPAVAPLLFSKGSSVVLWLSYWLGTGLKLVNAPLGLLYFFGTQGQDLFNIKKLFQTGLVIGVTGAMIWLYPLALYRSSLGVIAVYHSERVLQVESFSSLIIRGINLFTNTETTFLSKHKSFDLKGPLSDKMLVIANVSLVVSMMVMLAYIVLNRAQAANPIFMMKVTLIFILSYILTNKVFSTPYHLWYLPFITIFPYRSAKERSFFFTVSAVFLSVAMTPIPSIDFNGINFNVVLPILTQIPCTLLLFVGVYRLKTEGVFATHQPIQIKKKKT